MSEEEGDRKMTSHHCNEGAHHLRLLSPSKGSTAPPWLAACAAPAAMGAPKPPILNHPLKKLQ